MKRKTRKGLQLLLALVLVFSLVMMMRQMNDNSTGSDSYTQALAQAEAEQPPEETTEPAPEMIQVWVPVPVEDDPYMEEMAQISLDSLRQVNPDVIGWIRIPDSNVDYPIMQGEDNDYYLKNTWDNRKSSVGSIFMECRNNPDYMDYNTILYGHNMNDGSMFANVRRYNTQWYWERHPYIYVLTDYGVYRYEVFASYETKTGTGTYGLSFNQSETKVAFLENALEKSSIDTGIVPDLADRILTLSTCSGMSQSSRWVVHARMQIMRTEIEA